MNTHDLPEVADYLRRLDDALADLPPATAGELRSGIAEELHGLDADVAQDRMTELGDPAFIASTARGALGMSTVPRTGTAALWFILLAVAVFGFGGFVLPVVGWIVGTALVWVSPAWRRADKVIATAVPLGVSALVWGTGLAASLGAAAGMPPRYAESSSPMNPLVPAGFDALWSGVVLAVVVLPVTAAVVAVWLLVRALVRTGRLDARSPQYAVGASVTSGIGGFVIPVLGWIVGITMVWASDAWRRWQKVVATVIPLAAAAAVILVSAVSATTAPGIIDDPSGGDFQVPNPMLAQPLVTQWNVLPAVWIALPAAAVLVTVWLILTRRGPASQHTEEDA